VRGSLGGKVVGGVGSRRGRGGHIQRLAVPGGGRSRRSRRVGEKSVTSEIFTLDRFAFVGGVPG